MTLATAIILTAVVVETAVMTAARLADLRYTGVSQMPAEFIGFYEEADYHRVREYARATLRFSIADSLFSFLVLVVFWLAGGFEWLDEIIRSFGLSESNSGLAYIGSLVGGMEVISLPWQIYRTFNIEQRFGFNRTTVGTFVLDRLKGLLIAMLAGSTFLWLFLFILTIAGSEAWGYAWLMVTLVLILLQSILPALILPLFNRYEPLKDEELEQAVRSYADSVDFPLRNIYEMDGSRRSTKSNAFFTGMGRNRRVALFDTLIAQHSTAELVAVIAHEIGHYKKGHIWRRLIRSILEAGLFLFLYSLLAGTGWLFAAFGVTHASAYVGLVLFAIVLGPLTFPLSLWTQYVSRKHEFEADAFAARTLGSSAAMTAVLKKLSVNNLTNLTPHPFYAAIFYDHPPILERIRALNNLSLKG